MLGGIRSPRQRKTTGDGCRVMTSGLEGVGEKK